MLLVKEPLVPVTVRVATVGGRCIVPPPPPQDVIPTIRNTDKSMNMAYLRFLLAPQATIPTTAANRGDQVLKGEGPRRAFVVLETVTVKGTEVVVEVRLAGLGLTLQLAPPGAPVQVKLICPVKLPVAASVTL
jgi:hypothetical protein